MKSTSMTPEQFRAWRKGLGWKQKDAAEFLGLKKRMIQYYETGVRDGKKVKIPKYIRLACYALSSGVSDFDGEDAQAAPGHQRADGGASGEPGEAAEPADDAAGDGGAGADAAAVADGNPALRQTAPARASEAAK